MFFPPAGATRSTPPRSSRASTGRPGPAGRGHLISRTNGYHGTHGYGTAIGGIEANARQVGPAGAAVGRGPRVAARAGGGDPARRRGARRGLLLRAGVRRRRRPSRRPRATSRASRSSAREHGMLLVIDCVDRCVRAARHVARGGALAESSPDPGHLGEGRHQSASCRSAASWSRDTVAEPFFWRSPVARSSGTAPPTPASDLLRAGMANLDILEARGPHAARARAGRAAAWTRSRRWPSTARSRRCGPVRACWPPSPCRRRRSPPTRRRPPGWPPARARPGCSCDRCSAPSPSPRRSWSSGSTSGSSRRASGPACERLDAPPVPDARSGP